MEAMRPLLKLLADNPYSIHIILILTTLTILVGLLQGWVKYLEYRVQKARLLHEKEEWAHDLMLNTQSAMLAKRLEIYPEIIKTIKPLSGYSKNKFTGSLLIEIADKLQDFAYGDAATLMEADTRKAMIVLRDLCSRLGKDLRKDEVPDKNERIEKLLKARTDLLELLRRDLNLQSMWRDGQPHYLSTSESKLKKDKKFPEQEKKKGKKKKADKEK